MEKTIRKSEKVDNFWSSLWLLQALKLFIFAIFAIIGAKFNMIIMPLIGIVLVWLVNLVEKKSAKELPENEAAILTKNGVIINKHIGPGGQAMVWLDGTFLGALKYPTGVFPVTFNYDDVNLFPSGDKVKGSITLYFRINPDDMGRFFILTNGARIFSQITDELFKMLKDKVSGSISRIAKDYKKGREYEQAIQKKEVEQPFIAFITDNNINDINMEAKEHYVSLVKLHLIEISFDAPTISGKVEDALVMAEEEKANIGKIIQITNQRLAIFNSLKTEAKKAKGKDLTKEELAILEERADRIFYQSTGANIDMKIYSGTRGSNILLND